MTKQMKSTGVSAHINSFSSSEVDESVDLNVHNEIEADESSVTFENEKKVKVKPHTSGTASSVDYYAMKTKINPQFKHPCKIEFQRLNCNIKHKIRRQSSTCYNDHHPCTCQNYMSNQINPHVNAMNNQMSNPHILNYNDSDMTLENNDKAKSDDRKFRNIFSCFTCNSLEKVCENGEAEKLQKTEYYPFDHGDSKYYHTTDKAPQLVSDNAAEKVHAHATKFWAEVFGTLNIGVTFFLVFFIQFYRFILYSIFRSIIVGFLQTTSDYLIKPIFATTFNGIIQPILQFIKNILESTWDSLEPLAHMIMGFCLPIVECLRSIRLVDITTGRERMKQRNESIV